MRARGVRSARGPTGNSTGLHGLRPGKTDELNSRVSGRGPEGADEFILLRVPAGRGDGGRAVGGPAAKADMAKVAHVGLRRLEAAASLVRSRKHEACARQRDGLVVTGRLKFSVCRWEAASASRATPPDAEPHLQVPGQVPLCLALPCIAEYCAHMYIDRIMATWPKPQLQSHPRRVQPQQRPPAPCPCCRTTRRISQPRQGPGRCRAAPRVSEIEDGFQGKRTVAREPGTLGPRHVTTSCICSMQRTAPSTEYIINA